MCSLGSWWYVVTADVVSDAVTVTDDDFHVSEGVVDDYVAEDVANFTDDVTVCAGFRGTVSGCRVPRCLQRNSRCHLRL